VYVSISRRKNESTLVRGVVVVSALIATLTGCGEDAPSLDASSTTKPGATASPTAGSPKPARQTPQKPKKVTLSLAEVADTPGTFEQFKEFVAKHGTAKQKKAVKHLKGWRGYERKLVYPALEASSDYPTVDYEAIDSGDVVELEKMMGLEKQSQHIAEAFEAWWKVDEKAVLQVFDRSGEYTAGTACLRPDTVKNEGSCL
jgi:formylglycine-generating enzyme required for sulfatase activity